MERKTGSQRTKPDETAKTLMDAIRGKCIDCCCGNRKLVDSCKDKGCRLWPYRKEENDENA